MKNSKSTKLKNDKQSLSTLKLPILCTLLLACSVVLLVAWHSTNQHSHTKVRQLQTALDDTKAQQLIATIQQTIPISVTDKSECGYRDNTDLSKGRLYCGNLINGTYGVPAGQTEEAVQKSIVASATKIFSSSGYGSSNGGSTAANSAGSVSSSATFTFAELNGSCNLRLEQNNSGSHSPDVHSFKLECLRLVTE